MKIKEIELELDSRKKYVGDLASRMGDFRNAWDQDLIESFERYVTGDFFVFEQITTVDDLVRTFMNYYGSPPSENQQKILETKSDLILQEIMKNKRVRLEHPNQVRVDRIPSASGNIVGAVQNQEENREFNELIDKKRNEESRLSFLEEFKKDYRRELDAIAYPRYFKLGFISFISFAIFGVIAPFTYRWWSLYLKDYSNIFGLVMFGIGLIFAFLYIYLEMSFTLKNRKRDGPSERTLL